MSRTPLLILATLTLAGCEQLGLSDGKTSEAEGKAIGAACRHAGRALEDCYQINSSASKAAVFAGWKEMNDYMTEQKLEVVKPTLPPPLPKQKGKKKAAEEVIEEEEDNTASAPKADKAHPAGKKSGKDSADAAPAIGGESAPASESPPSSKEGKAPRTLPDNDKATKVKG